MAVLGWHPIEVSFHGFVGRLLLLLPLILRLLEADQGPSLLAVGAKMDQDGHFVVGQVVEPRLDDYRLIAFKMRQPCVSEGWPGLLTAAVGQMIVPCSRSQFCCSA